MLNKVILMGRLTRDPVVNQTQSGVAITRFTVAVDRNFVRKGEERQADFINCVAWRNQAEFIGRYFSKGRMIAVVGNLRTSSYDKDGVRHYTTEVYVDEVSFTGEPRQSGESVYQPAYMANNDFMSNDNNNTYQQQNRSSSYGNNNFQQPDESIDIGKLDDFEVFNDDGVPF